MNDISSGSNGLTVGMDMLQNLAKLPLQNFSVGPMEEEVWYGDLGEEVHVWVMDVSELYVWLDIKKPKRKNKKHNLNIASGMHVDVDAERDEIRRGGCVHDLISATDHGGKRSQVGNIGQGGYGPYTYVFLLGRDIVRLHVRNQKVPKTDHQYRSPFGPFLSLLLPPSLLEI